VTHRTGGHKPIVYIASPYSSGDVAINTHFQCYVFNVLLNDGRVLPVAPLWSHFQHLLFPRPYKEWIGYDLEMLHLYDCCLRVSATNTALEYTTNGSRGADAEVEAFKQMGKPVFFSIQELLAWVDQREWTTANGE
jgi:hypothetical protein